MGSERAGRREGEPAGDGGSGREPCAAGAGLVEMRKVCEQLVGAAVVDAALARLPLDRREEYASMTPLSWVRLSTSQLVMDAVAAESGRDPDELYERAVRQGIERSFRTVWRVLLHFT